MARPRDADAADLRRCTERGNVGAGRSAGGEVEVYVRDFGGGNLVVTRVIRKVEEGTPTLEADGGGGTLDHHDHNH